MKADLKSKKKKYIGKAVAIAICLTLTGCAFVPKEEAGKHKVIIEEQETVDYELAQVKRTDVSLTQLVYFTYSQMAEENLHFVVDGRKVQYVYVSAGEIVHKGDLLAKLDISDLEQSLAETSYTIERGNLLVSQKEELRTFDLKELEEEYHAGNLSNEEYAQKKEALNAAYDAEIQGYTDTLYIAGLRKQQLQSEINGSILYAGMDGTVSYIKNHLQGSYSDSEQDVIKIIDTSQCAFVCDEIEWADYFVPGERYTLKMSTGAEYEVMRISDDEAPDEEHLYLMPTDLDFSLTMGTRVSIRIILDERKNVLAVPASVIHNANGQDYVYLYGENGLRQMQYVKVGFAGDSLVEILEGLEEGQIVIKK